MAGTYPKMFPFRLLPNCSVAPFRPSPTLFDRSLPSSAVDMAKKRKSRVTADHDEATPSEVDHNAHVPEDTQKTLYEIIGVERKASPQEIKKAYYKLALRLHPDKNPGDEEAKEKFQQLQKVISVLGDEEKRAIYDQTGCIDDADLAGDMASNLQEYFRAMYKKVTEADIEEFEANYRGSEIEIKDLKDLYVNCKGNMNRLFCSMICSEPKLDSHRFKDIIDEAISSGELKSTKAYQKWAKIISETEPPVNPIKRRPKKSRKDSESDLVAAIVQRRSERKEQFESMFSTWTKKYGEGPSISEPSEEEFEAARKRLENKKKHARKHR